MKILVCYEDRVRKDSTGLYFVKALKDMGHEVLHVTPDRIMEVKEGTADFYLNVDCGLDWATFNPVLHPSAYYVIDTHLDTDWRLRLEHDGKFDMVFCAQKAGAKLPWNAKAEWLPLGADTDLHYVGDKDKKYDIAVIANFHSKYADSRLDRVDKIFKAIPNFFFGPRMFKDMAEKYSQSRLVFNSSLNQDINMRFFEAMMSGSCLLTDYISEMDEIGLVNGRHYVGYTSDEDMIFKAKHLLEDAAFREKVAKDGQHEVARHHKYSDRCLKILERVEELKSCLR